MGTGAHLHPSLCFSLATVAVTGLPEPQEDHAVIMARFARDCQKRMKEVTRELELTLGPDTGDLSMRFGLHSGPVTAGVLRGERSRFQLFGDTVNTAAVSITGYGSRVRYFEDGVAHIHLLLPSLSTAHGKHR